MLTRGSSRVERCHTDKTPSGTGKGLDLSGSLTILLLEGLVSADQTMLSDLGQIVEPGLADVETYVAFLVFNE